MNGIEKELLPFLFGVHYSTVRDYVFPLVDAAYCTLVIFVYIVLVL